MDEYYIHVEYILPHDTMRYYYTDTQDPKQAIAEAAEREGCKAGTFVYVRWLKIKRGKPFDPFDPNAKKPQPTKPFVRPTRQFDGNLCYSFESGKRKRVTPLPSVPMPESLAEQKTYLNLMT